MTPNARFEELHRAHKDAVLRVALRYAGGRRAFAEDVVQETFMKAWQNIDRLREGDAGGWLYVVATRTALSRLRHEAVRNNPLVRWFAPLPAQARDAAHDVEVSSEARASMQALDVLPPAQRVAFWMVHVDEKPLADVARVLECSVSYVSRLVSRAEATLQQAMTQSAGGTVAAR